MVKRYEQNSNEFLKIPNTPFAYWLSSTMFEIFDCEKISEIAFSDGQTKTGDNDKYLRLLWEVESKKIGKENKWVPHAKGGIFRRWYGNIDTLINWSQEARQHYKKDKVARIAPEYIWFRQGVCWNLITSSEKFAVRLLEDTSTFNLAAPSIFFESEDDTFYVLGLLNTIVSEKIIRMLNPTLNTNIGDVMAEPIIVREKENVIKITKDCIQNSKYDWNSFETAWDFKKHPLI